MGDRAGDSEDGSTRLLAVGEAASWTATNPGAGSPFLLLGDHAGRFIPDRLTNLGLSPTKLDRHIAWDIGVAGYGDRLAELLDATFIRQRVSRLVIDCNRDPARADAFPEVSDGAPIPGNRDLPMGERLARIAEVAAPYHAAIAAELDRRAALGLPTILVALHSFTPRMNGFERPWRFGVLHAENSPYSCAVLARLRGEFGEAPVGDNEPYRMDEVDFTIPHHAGGRGLDYLELEVRQDLVADPAGQADIATIFARLLPLALADLAAPPYRAQDAAARGDAP